jgi:hypothetical protein
MLLLDNMVRFSNLLTNVLCMLYLGDRHCVCAVHLSSMVYFKALNAEVFFGICMPLEKQARQYMSCVNRSF